MIPVLAFKISKQLFVRHCNRFSTKMEGEHSDDSEKKEDRCIDSDESLVVLDSVPKPSNAKDVTSMQLDFKPDRSSSFEIKPSTNNLPATSSFYKSKQWFYDDSIPQFGSKKFQGKGFSSTVARPSDNDVKSTRSDNSLKKLNIWGFSQPMSVDEAGDKKIISPDESQNYSEMQQTLAELIPSGEDLLKNDSKSFTEVNKATSSSILKSLDDIEMQEKSSDLIPNYDNAFKKNSENIPDVDKSLSPHESLNDIEMRQTSVEKSIEDNVLNSPPESITQAHKVLLPNECLGGIGIEKSSSEPISSEDYLLNKAIPEVNKTTSPTISQSLDDMKIQEKSAELILNEDNVFKNDSENGLQVDEALSTNECLDGVGMEKSSSEPISSEDNFLERSILQVNEITSPRMCSYGIEGQKVSIKHLAKDDKVHKNALISHSGDSSEGGIVNLTSECTKNAIHAEKAAELIANDSKVDDGERGVKRKHSGAKTNTNNMKVELIQNVVKQHEEENKAVRRSERIRKNSLRALILDRPSERTKNAIHAEKAAELIAKDSKVDDRKRGVKRKHSDAKTNTNNMKVELIQNVVKQHEEENKAVRRPEIIRSNSLRPLILDRPRRSKDVLNSSQK